MGTEYLLIKLDKYEYFDLGKAFGYPFLDHANDKPFLLTDIWPTASHLALDIEKRIKAGFFAPEYKKEAFVESHRLAGLITLWAAFDRLILRSDNSLDGIYYDLKRFDAITEGEWWEEYDRVRSPEQRERWKKMGSVYVEVEPTGIEGYKVVCDQSPEET